MDLHCCLRCSFVNRPKVHLRTRKIIAYYSIGKMRNKTDDDVIARKRYVLESYKKFRRVYICMYIKSEKLQQVALPKLLSRLLAEVDEYELVAFRLTAPLAIIQSAANREMMRSHSL